MSIGYLTPPGQETANAMDELLANMRTFDALRDASTDGRADTVFTRALPNSPPGDLDPEHRKLLKARPPAVLFTNPEMLRLSSLGWQEHWLRLFSERRAPRRPRRHTTA